MTRLPIDQRLARWCRMTAAALCAGLALAACDRTPTPRAAAENAPASGSASAVTAVAPASAPKASIFKPFAFEITGPIKDIPDGTELVLYPAYGGQGEEGEQDKGGMPKSKPLGSGTVSGGQVAIKGHSAVPQPALLYAKDAEFAMATLMVQEGQMQVAPDADGVLHVTNPRYGHAMDAQRSAKTTQLRAELAQAEAEVQRKGLRGKALAAAEERAEALSQALFAQQNSEEVAFVTNPASDAFERLVVLESNVDEETLTPARRLALLDEIEKSVGAHPVIDAKRKRLRQELAELGAKQTVVAGMPFKEVVGVDIHGKEVRLSDMVKANKVVLLDVWASWCGICRDEFPHLKKVYAKYRNQGFEVFAISTDERRKDWIKAMEQDKTTDAWPQLHDGRGQDANVAMDYGVNAYPSKFLITQDGKIVADSNSGKVNLDELLPKLLKP